MVNVRFSNPLMIGLSDNNVADGYVVNMLMHDVVWELPDGRTMTTHKMDRKPDMRFFINPGGER
jgi:hypothetical protein